MILPLLGAGLMFLAPSLGNDEPFLAPLRLALYETEWEVRAGFDDALADEVLALRDEHGSLYNLWAYLRSPAVMARGHYGPEKLAIKALRDATANNAGDYEAFQTPVCAPTAFPGAIGYGKNTLRCTLRDPVYSPLTSLNHIGLSGGATTCDSTGSLAPGGFGCEVGNRDYFRLVVPHIVGTRGVANFGNSVRVTGDSLVYIGRPIGGASGDRYDVRAASWISAGAQNAIDIRAKHVIWANSTMWDEECVGVSCSPDEGKQFLCSGSAGGDSIYVVNSDFHGNSGDDIATLGCSYATWARNFAGPVQGGGGQTTCITGGPDGTSTEITFADGGCIQAGHRTPLANQFRVELVNWVIAGWDSRNLEFSGTECCAELNARSVLLLSGKVTDGDKEDTWFLFRVHSLHASANTLLGEYADDSLYYKLDYGWLGIDSMPNDGSVDIHLSTVAGQGPSPISLWNPTERAAVCDKTSALGGDVSFPCTDSAGRVIDSLTFAGDTTLHTSDYSRVLTPLQIHSEILADGEMGNRFRLACDGTTASTQDYNAFADSMRSSTALDSWHAGVPGSFPDSMKVWMAGYPTATGMAADSAATSFSLCALNPNNVPDALADTLVALYGGVADDVDWGWDGASTGYELWRFLVQPDSLETMLLNAEGAPTHTFVLPGADSVSVIFVPLDSLFGTLWFDTTAVPEETLIHAACVQDGATDADSALVTVSKGDENSQPVKDSSTVADILTDSGPFSGCTIVTLRHGTPS